MPADKSDLLTSFFDQVESQVQFGDNKASLLVAGDALLLGITGALLKMVSPGCEQAEVSLSCLQLSAPPFVLAVIAALLLVVSLALALWATKPSGIHNNPTRNFFLISYWACRGDTADGQVEEIVKDFESMSYDDLQKDALVTILGKAKYATAKFRSLTYAVTTTLMSLLFIVASVVSAIAIRLLSK